jgi:NMD protein affecting ribosome stability and mRNA decay
MIRQFSPGLSETEGIELSLLPTQKRFHKGQKMTDLDQIELEVQGMTCDACARHVTEVLQ